MAQKALEGLPESDEEWSKLAGLIGRAYKQIAIDTRDPHCIESREALAHALDAYRKPYERNPNNTWHAINLVAVFTFAKRSGVTVPTAFDTTQLAPSNQSRTDRMKHIKLNHATEL